MRNKRYATVVQFWDGLIDPLVCASAITFMSHACPRLVSLLQRINYAADVAHKHSLYLQQKVRDGKHPHTSGIVK